jgi:heptosyltransferase I
VLLAPSASHSERVWMPERYAAVADYCHARGLRVAVTGSAVPHEMDLANLICDLADGTLINIAGQTSLKELLALCRHARLVIGPDSGTLHMAITQQTPVVGLYAHSNPRRTGPYQGLRSVADAYTDILASRGQEDQQQLWGYRLKGEALMREIQLDTVTSLINEALNKTL